MRYNLLIIIPARKNSKVIKNKNLIQINKKPLIFYSIKAAKLIKERSKVIFCSTDFKKIKNMALSFGAEVPFLRPKNISTDLSRDIMCVNHALQKYSERDIKFKYGLILRPTSPIRKQISLNNAYKKFTRCKFASSMRAVTPSPSNPYKTWILKKNLLKPVTNLKLKEFYNAPRQILPKTFWQVGSFDFFRINYKNNLKSVSGKKIIPYVVYGHEAIDIDKLDDVKKANIAITRKNFIK